jgi:hypothetical protein
MDPKDVLADWINEVLASFDALNQCFQTTGKKTQESTRTLCDPLNTLMTQFDRMLESTKHAVVKAETDGLDMKTFIQAQWEYYCPWIQNMAEVLLKTHTVAYLNCVNTFIIEFPLSRPLLGYATDNVGFGSERFKAFPHFLNINGSISVLGCAKCSDPARHYCVCNVLKSSLVVLKQNYLDNIDPDAKLDGVNKKSLQEALLRNTQVAQATKYKKEQLKRSFRFLIWNTYIGKEHGVARCWVCEENPISQQDFHACHVLAECNGGKTILSNFRPGCSTCNSSMKSMNMMEYKEQLDAFKRGRAIEEKDYLE